MVGRSRESSPQEAVATLLHGWLQQHRVEDIPHAPPSSTACSCMGHSLLEEGQFST